MLPFQSNVERDTKKNFKTKTPGSGLSASHSQARGSSGLGITGAMTTALQSTDALFAELEHKLDPSNREIDAKFLRFQTAAGNFVAIRQEVKTLKKSVAQQLGVQDQELRGQNNQQAEELNELRRQLSEKES